ncbi:short-chain dehydrogenase [Prauserella marina]|uniref:NAD(P)-dependent dehydrogenase, short-chain alcohol dehydrogenase family n=1 Tax=Prauserella marina TaxID=530584 RepID=A0A222VW43_9PSEU|nr:SDR family oxidoreductase [Prauserella marina]ASR38148.1 short-chain dehydrogenase [Prauserella marina]PWV78684.1 NAD(P)-dependent dehydrogenase (short-subunit alcohol dehydrogenase family) [Prauserella marina]SDC91466.1 NAD(P)-dependent dehydrogenase, short-chain alcohol dehydrogenase family [Prauserella marina]
MNAAGELLADKVVVVSGVGPGLGRSIAVRSALAGAKIVLAARTSERLDEVAKEIDELGGQAVAVRTDVTDDDSASALVESTLAHFGRVDTLVNNAFAIPPITDLADVDIDAVRAGFETNVLAALRLTRLFTEGLSASSGSVVMINSAVLRHSRRTFGPYKMSKAALLALSQSLATELGPLGVRVNSVAPGYIWAGSLRWYFGYLAEKRGVSRQEVYDEVAATTDLRKLPDPDEIADAVVFLASPLARAITGHCLDVNSGEYHN